MVADSESYQNPVAFTPRSQRARRSIPPPIPSSRTWRPSCKVQRLEAIGISPSALNPRDQRGSHSSVASVPSCKIRCRFGCGSAAPGKSAQIRVATVWARANIAALRIAVFVNPFPSSSHGHGPCLAGAAGGSPACRRAPYADDADSGNRAVKRCGGTLTGNFILWEIVR